MFRRIAVLRAYRGYYDVYIRGQQLGLDRHVTTTSFLLISPSRILHSLHPPRVHRALGSTKKLTCEPSENYGYLAPPRQWRSPPNVVRIKFRLTFGMSRYGRRDHSRFIAFCCEYRVTIAMRHLWTSRRSVTIVCTRKTPFQGCVGNHKPRMQPTIHIFDNPHTPTASQWSSPPAWLIGRPILAGPG